MGVEPGAEPEVEPGVEPGVELELVVVVGAREALVRKFLVSRFHHFYVDIVDCKPDAVNFI